MVSKNTVLISVNILTKAELDKLKLHPNLSYNDVVVGLIKDRDEKIAIIGNQSIAEFKAKQELLAAEEMPNPYLCNFCNAVEVIDEKLGKITQHEILCNAPKTSTGL